MAQYSPPESPSTPLPPPHAERILLIRPSALGDVCRTVPVLASLRAAYPRARIDWLVQDTFAPAILRHPALSSAVPFPRGLFGRYSRRARFGPILRWMGGLRRARYDLVLDCQGLARSGMFAWATRAPRRIGYANAQEGAWLAYTIRERVERSLHAVDRMLRLVQAAGIPARADMRLYCDPEEAAAVEEDPQLRGGGYVLIAPTSRWPGKRWPQERFAGAIRRLLESGVDRVVLVGSESEREQCSVLTSMAASDPRVVDRIGATSIGRLMALVRRAAVVLCNDSAVLHMAVGFDRPIVALYGPTRISRVGPYRREGDVIQHLREDDRADHKDPSVGVELMSRIGVDEVVHAVLDRRAPALAIPAAPGPTS